MIRKVSLKILDNYDYCESVFLYGSSSREEDNVKDIELGVIFKSEVEKSQSTLLNELDEITSSDVNAFPFIKDNMTKGEIITSFTSTIFCYNIIKDGETIVGKNIVENLSIPNIKEEDLRREVGFQLGQALASLKSYRNNNYEIAKEMYSKSVLFGARAYIYKKEGVLYTNYSKIVKESKRLLNNKEYIDCVENAHNVRNGKKLKQSFINNGISFLREKVERECIKNL